MKIGIRSSVLNGGEKKGDRGIFSVELGEQGRKSAKGAPLTTLIRSMINIPLPNQIAENGNLIKV